MKLQPIAILITMMVFSPVSAEESKQQLESILEDIITNDFRSDKGNDLNWKPATNQYGDLSGQLVGGSIVLLKNKDNLLPIGEDSHELHIAGPSGNFSTERQIKGQPDVRPGRVNVALVGVETRKRTGKGSARAARLPRDQISTLRDLKRSSESPLVVIIMGKRPISLPEVYDIADAIIYVWQPQEDCSATLAGVIFGEINPCGRLPFAVPYFTRDLPSSSSLRTPQFPFGFGLSYSDFEYTGISISSKQICGNDTVDVSVCLRNNGSLAGREVVQLYVQLPSTGRKSPIRRLVGFEEIQIPAGETREVQFTIEPQKLKQKGYGGEFIVIPGAYVVTAGGAYPVQRSVDLGMPKPKSTSFAVESNSADEVAQGPASKVHSPQL